MNYLPYMIEVGEGLWRGGSKTRKCHYLSVESSRLQLTHSWFSAVQRTNHKMKQWYTETWWLLMAWSSYSSSAYICKDIWILLGFRSHLGHDMYHFCLFSTERIPPGWGICVHSSSHLHFTVFRRGMLIITPCLKRSYVRKTLLPSIYFQKLPNKLN